MKARFSADDILAVLIASGKPESRNSLATLTKMSLPSVYRYAQLLLAADKIYISHTRSHSRGGLPEIFYMVGPTPEGHMPRPLPISEEEKAAKLERRKNLQRHYSREYKKRRRAKERAAYLAAHPEVAKKLEAKALTEDELDWVDPNWRYRPSAYAEPFMCLMQVWHSAVKGNNHADTH